MECKECNKELFLSQVLAKNAAKIYGWIYRKRYRIYECPKHPGDYHLTTGGKGRKKPPRRSS